MKRFIIPFLLSLIFAGLMAGCNQQEEPLGGAPETATLNLLLTDAPGDYDAILITFSQISANLDSNWITFLDTPRTVDLLAWQNGRTLLVGSEDIPAGRLHQVRLLVDSARVVVDGVSYNLEVPSGAQTGLKLNVQSDIPADAIYELVLDFDAGRSVLRTGNGRYKLKPVIRAMPRAVTGSITGTIVNGEHLPVAYAMAGPDTITSSLADPFTGSFQLAFLPEGVYSVSISDTTGRGFVEDSVSVRSGNSTDLGSIILQ
ncbi:MAG: DUF4382 domain-containing protein [Calditrichaeota bacterium]|nr:DUF4382 domain-containing protein [Calditrichota bacterium]HQU74423.1 DUF4382 domain-containing protein [Calditrichia bacterium]